MKQYLEALDHVLKHGNLKTNRTGISTYSLFGYEMKFDLKEGFPAVTTKKLKWKAVVSELLWFLSGSTDERRLAEIHYKKDRKYLAGKSTIWTSNADKQAVDLGYVNNDSCKELGPIYGHQWRNLLEIDQINELVYSLSENPDSRRHILTAWNPNAVHKMALPPCHILAQFDVTEGHLSCKVYQRSADLFLGVPFNIASYALLTHILAELCNLKVNLLIWTGGDVHIYNNHVEQVKEQLTRTPLTLPMLKIPFFVSIEDVLDSSVDDFCLMNYYPMEAIYAPMAI